MEGNKISDCLGEILHNVYFIESTFSVKNNKNVFDEIVFIFETQQLRILPNIDTDEILFFVEKPEEGFMLKKVSVFSAYIGKTLNLTWNCFNSKGYFDILILSFHQLHPSIMILSEGSSLKVTFLQK